ncbi:hypothetical protein C5167_008946 [Papaver somniferum]|uniref:EF-hand domain-containing protein n=1 Tax=Papaver somniferum TaxID=3469 RepID=A0A4Y7JXF5_PAPSO|nr:hypothetical protein C5167_008946 [Papaver somniferum]
MMMNKICINLLMFLVLISSVQSRFITLHSSDHTDLISDGITDNVEKSTTPSIQLLNRQSYLSEGICEETYGFLPCTTTVFGNLFLIIIYGALMFLAARFLSTGSELLLEILGPGIVGGLFLPMLGALPDALLILVSGISGTKEIAQEQVLVGMGLLAGSTVMLLTLLWGSCVVLGKCDIEDSTAVDLKDTKRLSLTGSGVTVDIWTKYASWIMIISVVPFIIVQLPQILHINSGRHLVVLISLIVSVTLLISYCLYQRTQTKVRVSHLKDAGCAKPNSTRLEQNRVSWRSTFHVDAANKFHISSQLVMLKGTNRYILVFQPWIQRRKLAYAKHKHVMSGILRHLDLENKLMTDDYSPNIDVIKKLFRSLDLNDDETLSVQELRALVIGIRFEEIEFDKEDAVIKVLSDFDTSRDGCVDEEEFIRGISKWLDEAKPHKMIHKFYQHTKKEHDQWLDESDEVAEGVENPNWISVKAGLLLLLGATIAAAFADPLVDTVNNFSTATSIPPFFISFIALPLATNSSEAIYGAVTMNNILCLSVFLALVYVRGLSWDFSAEVLVILIVCVVMGLFTSFHTTFPLWTCSVAYVLYPFSLVLVYLLDYVFGWS